MQSARSEIDMDDHALLNLSIAYAEMNNNMLMPQPFNMPVATMVDNEEDP